MRPGGSGSALIIIIIASTVIITTTDLACHKLSFKFQSQADKNSTTLWIKSVVKKLNGIVRRCLKVANDGA